MFSDINFDHSHTDQVQTNFAPFKTSCSLITRMSSPKLLGGLHFHCRPILLGAAATTKYGCVFSKTLSCAFLFPSRGEILVFNAVPVLAGLDLCNFGILDMHLSRLR